MDKPILESRSIKQLHSLLILGNFAVPKLQRAFVWNGIKAAKLLDSVYRGMPIGSLTIWDTSRKNRNLLRHSLHVLPPYSDHNKRIWFVLDGQQRLSVLYQIFEGGERTNAAHRTVDFDRVTFRVTEGEDSPRFLYRKAVEGEWVPVKTILSPYWRAQLGWLTAGQLNRIRRCREALLDYSVPILRVSSEEIDEARELFIRINSLGTPIGAADRAFSRASKFDLREIAERTWARLPTSFQELTHETLLQTRALLDGIRDVGERAMEEVVARWEKNIEDKNATAKSFNASWERQRRAIERTLDCLRVHFSVLDDSLLPSQYMVATLAVFFYHRQAQATDGQLREIRNWFWMTALGQRYSGRGFRDNILSDAVFFKRLSTSGTARFPLTEKLDPNDLDRASYGQRSSMSDALYCLMIRQQPRYLANGHEMQLQDYASPANRKHKHHVFPKALLAGKGINARQANKALNLCFISGEENSAFGARHPRNYLASTSERKHFARVMESHLLPRDKNSAIWDPNVHRGYKAFIKERRKLIVRAVETAVGGAKLFQRA